MTNSIFLNMILNIGLLVLVATLLTKIPVVRRLLLDENNTPASRAGLAVIFGLVSILSTYTGTNVQGAIVNTRVIGVLAAGLLGGPFVGIGAAVIAGTHRYLFDIGGFTALSCAISTFAEGMLGALFSRYFRRGDWNNLGIFLLTAVTELIQMIIILCIARPFADALALVRIIAAPMIVLNSFGMIVFIGTFNIVFAEDDNAASGQMRLALHIADQSLPHLRQGLQSRKDMEAAAQIIFQSLKCSGILITNTSEILACSAHEKEFPNPLFNQIPQPVLDAMEQKQVVVHTTKDAPALKNHVLIAAPLIELEQVTGCLVLIARRQWHSSHGNAAFLKELARLFSTQLELADLDYQKRQRKKAEYRALRSQINPHFLYNALNTIACVCRENPDRSRELLLTPATYYRQTLENDRNMASLTTELYQVTNYLALEKARFEEKLQVEIMIPDDLDCLVPSFILQPLVENAIRHGSDRRGCRYVKIQASQEPTGVRIAVSDHGPGFDPAVLEQFYSGERTRSVGLSNVHQRLKNIYGETGGLQIVSSEHGSCVSFLITPSPAADLLASEDLEPTKE